MSKKIHVLFVITKSDLGGAQKVVSDLLGRLVDHEDFAVTLLAGETGPLTSRTENLGVDVIIEPSLHRDVSLLSDLLAIRKLRLKLRELNPDIVHIHSSKAGLLGRLAAVRLKCKVIFTVHGWVFKRDASKFMFGMLVRLEKILARLTDFIVLVSKDDAFMAQEFGISPRSRMLVILNGVDDIRPLIDRQISEKLPLKLVMVARYTEQKDQILLVRAVSELDRKVELDLIGDGPKMEQAAQFINGLNTVNPVRLIGASEDVPSLLNQYDVGLLISNWEGLPISIIEYMRAGMPVIATDVGGVAELVENEVTGYLVPRGDINSIRTALTELVDDRKKLEKFGANARHRYLEEFSLDRMAGKYIDLYREAVYRVE